LVSAVILSLKRPLAISSVKIRGISPSLAPEGFLSASLCGRRKSTTAKTRTNMLISSLKGHVEPAMLLRG
jgi:hypothetical protein